MSNFKSGNYNSFDDLIHTDLPRIQNLFEQVFLPMVSRTLISMIGRGREIEKSEVNANIICESGKLESVDFETIFIVEDFQVPDAPKAAIENDIEAIKNTLTIDGTEIKTVEIDVETGALHIVLSVPFANDESDTDVVSEEKSDEMLDV